MAFADAQQIQEQEVREQRYVRIRRAKQFLRPLPRKATLHRWPVLKWFAKTARQRPYLWSFRVREVSVALYLGLVLALLPLVGIQFFFAFGIALTLRANLPIIMGAQLITNVVTIAPIYYLLNKIGSHIIHFLGLQTLESSFGQGVYSIVIGGVITGLTIAFALDMIYRFAFAHAKKSLTR